MRTIRIGSSSLPTSISASRTTSRRSSRSCRPVTSTTRTSSRRRRRSSPPRRSAAKNGRLRLDPASWDVAVVLNLTRPPFDDVHVRRAMTWLLDRAALRATRPGSAGRSHGTSSRTSCSAAGSRATRRSRRRGDHGDLARAKAEMAKSKYATQERHLHREGVQGVFFVRARAVRRLRRPGKRMTPIIKADAAKIGITFGRWPVGRARQPVEQQWRVALTNVELGEGLSPIPSSYVDPLFDRHGDRARADNLNYSLARAQVAAGRATRGEGRCVRTCRASTPRSPGLRSARGCRRGSTCYASLDRELTAGSCRGSRSWSETGSRSSDPRSRSGAMTRRRTTTTRVRPCFAQGSLNADREPVVPRRCTDAARRADAILECRIVRTPQSTWPTTVKLQAAVAAPPGTRSSAAPVVSRFGNNSVGGRFDIRSEAASASEVDGDDPQPTQCRRATRARPRGRRSRAPPGRCRARSRAARCAARKAPRSSGARSTATAPSLPVRPRDR